MATVYDVSAEKLINATAKDLKENIKIEMPQWAKFVKTGAQAERKPESPDWWYMRSASLLRRIYMEGPVGVERLRTYYGARKNRGLRPHKFVRASGKVIREALKSLDEKGLTESGKSGRKITPQGRSYLDKISTAISKK
jgi:small subunit ribosomal protein S19e